MRTNIDIDDELMAAAMKATGQKTKKSAVEEALRRVVRQQAVRDLIEHSRGIGWRGDLDAMREGRSFAEDEAPFDHKP